MTGIFDTHAHYDDEAFDADREELLESMREAGIVAIANAASNLESTDRAWELARRYSFLYCMAGVHPSDVGELNERTFERLRGAACRDRVVAVGEIGLDYYWDKEHQEEQKYWFVRQLELARELDLPVMIHSRDAARDTLEIVRSAAKGLCCDIHCFSYGVEMAREFLRDGHYLGIGGVVTFRNARKLQEVASYAPLDRILLETDCPYLSPVPNRGKRNSSRNLPYVVEKLAELRHITVERVIEATYENALRFFGERVMDAGQTGAGRMDAGQTDAGQADVRSAEGDDIWRN